MGGDQQVHPLDSHCQTDSADRQDAAGGEVPGEEQQGETESRRGRKGQNTAAEQTTMTSVTANCINWDDQVCLFTELGYQDNKYVHINSN